VFHKHVTVNIQKFARFAFLTESVQIWTYPQGPTIADYDGAVADDITYGRKDSLAATGKC